MAQTLKTVRNSHSAGSATKDLVIFGNMAKLLLKRCNIDRKCVNWRTTQVNITLQPQYGNKEPCSSYNSLKIIEYAKAKSGIRPMPSPSRLAISKAQQHRDVVVKVPNDQHTASGCFRLASIIATTLKILHCNLIFNERRQNISRNGVASRRRTAQENVTGPDVLMSRQHEYQREPVLLYVN